MASLVNVGGVDSILPVKRKPELNKIVKQDDVIETVNRITEVLSLMAGQNSDRLERAITYKDMVASGFGLAELGDSISIIPPPPEPETPPNLTVPPLVTGVSVSTTFNFVLMFWDAAAYSNHSFVEIWRANAWQDEAKTIPTNIGNAAFLVANPTTAYADKVLPLDEYRYWFRNISDSGIYGAYSADFIAVVPPKPSYLIDIISGEIKESDLYVDLGTKIDDSYTTIFDNATGLFDLVNDPSTGLVVVVDGITLQLDDPTTGLEARFATTSAIVSDPVTGLVVIVDGITLQLDDPTTGLEARFSTVNSIVTDPVTGLVDITSGISGQLDNPVTGLEARFTDLNAIVTDPVTGLTDVVNSLDLQLNAPTTGTEARLAVTSLLAENNEGLIDASYTVKLDVGGYISGFGLMNSGAFSQFVIRADRFSISPPLGDANDTLEFIPFIVDGANVLIKNAFIDSAYIETIVATQIDADYINALNLTAVTISGGSITIGNDFEVNTSGIMFSTDCVLTNATITNGNIKNMTIKDVNNNIIMASSGAIDNSYITGLGGLALADSVVVADVSDFSSGVTTIIDSAYINTLFAVQIFAGSIYAENIEGDVTDSLVKVSTATTTSGDTVLSFSISALPFQRDLIVSGLRGFVMSASSTSASLTFSLKKDGVVVDTVTSTVSIVDSANTGHGSVPFLRYSLAASDSDAFTVELSTSGGHYAQDVLIQAFQSGTTIS